MSEVWRFLNQSYLHPHQIVWSVICRLRPDNTYLLLDEFGENGTEDTGLTTELGVMSNEEEEHRGQQVCFRLSVCLLQALIQNQCTRGACECSTVQRHGITAQLLRCDMLHYSPLQLYCP